MEPIIPNITDVALIFEGGGMRNSATAAMVEELLDHNLNFDRVYGISAGSSHTINYLMRDKRRSRVSFTDLVKYPRFGGWRSFLLGKGFFNGPYIYEGLVGDLAGTDDPMRFDWDTFSANQAEAHIEAFDWDTGDTVAWTREHMRTPEETALRVRASSSMPLFMPPCVIDGHTYMDGGMGTSWGLLLNAAREDGYKRFCIIRTQPRGYRKKPLSPLAAAAFRTAFRDHPLVAERTIERWQPYNELCDEIERLEADGSAFVYYPDMMNVTNKTTDFSELQLAYIQGYKQAKREIGRLEAWL